MRVVYKRYADGGVRVEQTDDDGSNPRPLRQNDAQSGDDNGIGRVSTYVVVSFDDREEERECAVEALKELAEELGALSART